MIRLAATEIFINAESERGRLGFFEEPHVKLRQAWGMQVMLKAVEETIEAGEVEAVCGGFYG